MSAPPYGWCCPPYIRRRFVDDFCYVDEDNPANNYHQQFALLREYKAGGGARGQKIVYLTCADAPVAGADQIDFLTPFDYAAPPPGGDSFAVEASVWQAGAALFPEITFIVQIEVVTGDFDPATMTWADHLLLGNVAWMQTRLTLPGMTYNAIGGLIWHIGFPGCEPARLLAPANATGWRITVDVDTKFGAPDNFFLDSTGWPFNPNPTTQQWACIQAEP